MNEADIRRVTKLSCISSAATLLAGSADVDELLETAAQLYDAVMEPGAYLARTAVAETAA